MASNSRRRRSAFGGMLAERVAFSELASKVDFEPTAKLPEAPCQPAEKVANPLLPRKTLWRILGGERKGGVIVRTGVELDSSVAANGRLSTGAVVEEIRLEGDRLHYWRLTGSGPNMGWITVALNDKVLAETVSEMPTKNSNNGGNVFEGFLASRRMSTEATATPHSCETTDVPRRFNGAASRYGVEELSSELLVTLECRNAGDSTVKLASTPMSPDLELTVEAVSPATFQSPWDCQLSTPLELPVKPSSSVASADPAPPVEQVATGTSAALERPICATSSTNEPRPVAAPSREKDEEEEQEEDETTSGEVETTSGSSSTRSKKPHDIEIEYSSFQLPSIHESALNELADMTAKQAGISVLRRDSLLSENLQATPGKHCEPVAVFCFSPPTSPHESQDEMDEQDEYDFESFNDRVQRQESASPEKSGVDVSSPTRLRCRGGA